MVTSPDRWTDAIEAYAKTARAGTHWRAPKTFHPEDATHFFFNDRRLLHFATNDYLALSVNDVVREATVDAAARFSASATASRLVAGTRKIHIELEAALSALKQTEDCRVFPTGYQTALTVIPALVEISDFVLLDAEAHASLIDGARLSGAKFSRFEHNSPAALDALLKKRAKPGRRFFVEIESLYSMSGDVAPVEQIASVCEDHCAMLLVDEAHATGVLGEGGAGCCKGLSERIDANRLLIMGTLSKALASQGGFLCSSRLIVEHLVQKARGYIYSTGLSPVCVAAALAAVQVLPSLDDARESIRRLSSELRERLGMPSISDPQLATPIIPFIVGSDKDTMALSAGLENAGFFVPAIRPPTVPQNAAQLRFSINAAHTIKDIVSVSSTVQKLKNK